METIQKGMETMQDKRDWKDEMKKEIHYLTQHFPQGVLVSDSEGYAKLLAAHMQYSDGFSRHVHLCSDQEKELISGYFEFESGRDKVRDKIWITKIDMEEYQKWLSSQNKTIVATKSSETIERTRSSTKRSLDVNDPDRIKQQKRETQEDNLGGLEYECCYGGMFCDGCTLSKVRLDVDLANKPLFLKDRVIEREGDPRDCWLESCHLIVTHRAEHSRRGETWIPNKHSIVLIKIKRETRLWRTIERLKEEGRPYYLYFFESGQPKLVEKNIRSIQ